MEARSRGVIAAMTIWKTHCVQVVMAQQEALMCSGKISEQTFHDIGPSETEKEKAKM